MSIGCGLIDARVHDAVVMRAAEPGLLQLALMDARNRTLGWLAAFDGLQFDVGLAGFDPPGWLAGQAAWQQEYWIARHVQRARGEAADPAGLRLPSVSPHADAWFNPQAGTRAQRWQQAQQGGSTSAELHHYLADTLDTTLALLDKAGPDDDALHVYRAALWHEDRIGEALAVLVQALDLAPERCKPLAERGLWPTLPSRNRREPLGLPGQRSTLGSLPGGFVPGPERWAQPASVEAFEIDAQPVAWQQFTEFVDDGGYDDRRWWSQPGWDQLDASARRVPRYVEQAAGGVLARRHGRLQRVPGAQAVVHVNAHEAEAWCRWAGRRLPSEAEWELAARAAGARGFAWGDVAEWVAGSARPLAGGPPLRNTLPDSAPLRLLRGGSAWGSSRLLHPHARRFVAASRDELFVGFRSCAA